MKETPYFRPRNWSKFQSRSNNSMAWVKLYTAILSDPDYSVLTDNQKLTWLELLLLFGRTGRPLPLNSQWIGSQLARDSRAIGRALPALKSNNFIELCERTEKLHDEVASPRVDKIREEKKETPPISPSDDDLAFDEFWSLYPRQRRGNKQKARQAWRGAINRASVGEILSGERAYVASDEVKRGFAKGAAAWLNDDRWTTDYLTFREKTKEDWKREFLDGDEGNDLGHGVLDGECVEVSGRRSEGNGGGLPCRLAGSERRSDNGRGDGTVVELDKAGAPEAGGLEDQRRRVEALVKQVAKATKS